MTQEHRVTILIVDDDEGHLELVRRNLRRSGINNPITSLTRGGDALDYVFSRGAYADRAGNSELLILLDIKMPGACDGVEVLRQIKADARAKLIPVIMLTTADDPREINRCYELGCNVYITKPVEPVAFIEAVRRVGLMLSVMRVPIGPERLP
jgi:CheY-like chemotaxis protein